MSPNGNEDPTLNDADDLLIEELVEAKALITCDPDTDAGNGGEGASPTDSQPRWSEINALLEGEHPTATGERLLFRLGRLVCNLPLEASRSLWLLGREGDLDLALPNPSMSRKHFQLRREAGEVYLKDLNARNGTFLNRRRLEPNAEHVLANGDWIFAGQHYFLFIDDSETMD